MRRGRACGDSVTGEVGSHVPPERVLVVIPCLNERHTLPDVLASILSDAGIATALIAVVDGGSTDGTVEWLRAFACDHPRILLLDNPRKLQSAAVNLAAQHLGEGVRWLARVDAHCRYPPGFVSGLLVAAARTGADAVATPMVSEAHGCFQRGAAAAQNSRLGTGGSAHRHVSEGAWIDHAHHALIDLRLFLEVGGYDESFVANEDAEFDMRFARAGGRIWLSGDAPIVYYPRSAPGSLFRQYYKYGAGRARTLLLQKARPRLRQALPLAIAPAVALFILSPLFWPLALPALSWAALCLGCGAVLAAKAKDPCAFASGPAAMIMHLAWSAGFWISAVRRLGGPFARRGRS